VYFNVTSKDVIHNFWAVELGVKIDANPGAITQTGVTPDKVGLQRPLRGTVRHAPRLHGDRNSSHGEEGLQLVGARDGRR
jgi:hypothetical protein